VAVIGDPGEVMAEMANAVEVTETERQRRKEVIPTRRDEAREFVFVDREDRPDDSISKAALTDAMAEVVPEGFVVNESNTSKYALLTRWQLNPEQFIANKNGGLGYGLPATVGAAVAMRERENGTRPVVGFIGDGSYLYYPQTLYTAARYDLDLTVVVPDNRNYRILKDGMLNIYGGTDDDHEYLGMDFDPAVDLVQNAESNGATGLRVSQRENLEMTLTEAVEADVPVVVSAQVHD
jgi:benzoylformate decarboxylase